MENKYINIRDFGSPECSPSQKKMQAPMHPYAPARNTLSALLCNSITLSLTLCILLVIFLYKTAWRSVK